MDFHIINFTALSVEILDHVQLSTTYSDFSFYPCEINYLKTYTYPLSLSPSAHSAVEDTLEKQ